MTVRKRLIIAIIIILLLFFCLSAFSYSYDTKRAESGKTPVFILHKDALNDGGTTVYYGFGYQIVAWHQIKGDGYYTGTESHWLFGFRSDFHSAN